MPTKKQHFVPRVYLKAWETQVETLKEPNKKFKGIYVILHCIPSAFLHVRRSVAGAPSRIPLWHPVIGAI